MSTDMSAVHENYLATWNETDPSARRALLAEHWGESASYVDPMAAVAGRDQVDATVTAVQAQFPGFVFTAQSEPDAHHDQVRFTWGLGPAGEEPVVVGFDVVITDDEGRIAAVYGFLDKVPG